MFNQGTVVLTHVQFTDSFETKLRPAVVLFEEQGNIVVAGVTSNTQMTGIPLTITDGVKKPSVIKLNYIFTISEKMIEKVLFSLSKEKKELVLKQIIKRLQPDG